MGRDASHRKDTLRLLATALLRFQRIKTTMRKAKEARRVAEGLITLAKRDDLTARRRAFSVLTNRDIVERLFRDVAPLFKNRASGYTRIIPLGFRKGDGAQMVLLELTEKKIIEKAPKKAKAAKKEAAADAKAAKPKEEAKGAEVKEAPKKLQEEPKPRGVPKSKPTFMEEKAKEKAKTEDKKMEDRKGFMRNLRGYFRKRGRGGDK